MRRTSATASSTSQSGTRHCGISRPPLREAIRVLVHQGLLERMPRRETHVAELVDELEADWLAEDAPSGVVW